MVTPLDVPIFLRLLAAADAFDAEGIQDAVAALARSLSHAIASYQGFRLTLVDDEHPVSMIDFAAQDLQPSTSLRVDLSLLVSDADPASRIVFYAEAPGAFVDLAADLQHALRGSADSYSAPEVEGPDVAGTGIELDGDLPPISTVSAIVGLAEFSTINRAVGLLIGRGLSPECAHEALCVGAAAATVEKHLFAALLLEG